MPPTTRREQVMAAVKSIRAFHRLGRQLRHRLVGKEGYGRGLIEAEAEALGMNPDLVRKARQFADPENGYTVAELNELCRLIRTEQLGDEPGEPVFGRTHLIRMLSVPGRQRARLQLQAIRDGWSVRELEAEIARRFGTRASGGRTPKVPVETSELLTQAEQMCESWRRWWAAVPAQQGKAQEQGKGLLPAALRRQMDEVSEAVEELRLAVLAELARAVPGRQARTLPGEGKDAGPAARKRSGGASGRRG